MIQKLRAATTPYTIVADRQTVHVPADVVALDSFLHWARSDDFPEDGRICYLAGEVWIDMSKEQVFWHNQVKTEFCAVLASLVKRERLGRFFSDGLRLTHESADLSCVPDGSFVTHEGLMAERVRPVEGARVGYVEMEGCPDVAIEIVSDGSVRKDTETLHHLYWLAGVAEYWLVDVRGERLDFDILRHAAKGYVATRKQGGWLKSKVFGKSFRLTREIDAAGYPDYTLDVR